MSGARKYMEEESRILSEAECRQILERAHAFARGGGETAVRIKSWWQGELRWARNRAALSSDRRNVAVTIMRKTEYGGAGSVTTNQVDDAALEAAVRAAERKSDQDAKPNDPSPTPMIPSYTRQPTAPIWSAVTVGVDTASRAEIARKVIAPAEMAGFYSAGYLEVREAATATYSTAYRDLLTGEYSPVETPYIRWTQAQCSTTVRDVSGMGSGWAGLSSYDWERIGSECDALAERAVQKCRASRNPVALEPGRYTVILEPQAVADLIEMLVRSLERDRPEEKSNRYGGPWRLGYDEATQLLLTKMGLKVVDERVTIEHDPLDPRLGIVMSPLERPGPVTWIENGVLTSLGHSFIKGIEELDKVNGLHTLRSGIGYRMSGGETSIEEMIRTTRRGLLVTRFSNMRALDDFSSLLTTGLTRDGLWLIENGEITKAVKNFRFTESPLFMLNNIEQIGEAVPVFRPTKKEGGELTPAIVPPIKARDFSFTSLIDAV